MSSTVVGFGLIFILCIIFGATLARLMDQVEELKELVDELSQPLEPTIQMPEYNESVDPYLDPEARDYLVRLYKEENN